jgi:hypothetical protein
LCSRKEWWVEKQFSKPKKKFQAIFLQKKETHIVSNKLVLPLERETQRPYKTSTKLHWTYDTDRFYLQAQQIRKLSKRPDDCLEAFEFETYILQIQQFFKQNFSIFKQVVYLFKGCYVVQAVRQFLWE